MREHFMPPPVEPAHAPTNISIRSSVLEAHGQRLKSEMEKPEVLIMDAAVKAAWRNASPKLPKIGRKKNKNTANETKVEE